MLFYWILCKWHCLHVHLTVSTASNHWSIIVVPGTLIRSWRQILVEQCLFGCLYSPHSSICLIVHSHGVSFVLAHFIVISFSFFFVCHSFIFPVHFVSVSACHSLSSFLSWLQRHISEKALNQNAQIFLSYSQTLAITACQLAQLIFRTIKQRNSDLMLLIL